MTHYRWRLHRITAGPLLHVSESWPFWQYRSLPGLPGRIFVRTFEGVYECDRYGQ